MRDGLVLRYRPPATASRRRAAAAAKGSSSPAASGSPTTTSSRAGGTRRCALFERLLALRNDVGLLAEEYDPRGKRLLGNFPQAFSHLALVNTAYNLAAMPKSPAKHRCF